MAIIVIENTSTGHTFQTLCIIIMDFSEYELWLLVMTVHDVSNRDGLLVQIGVYPLYNWTLGCQ